MIKRIGIVVACIAFMPVFVFAAGRDCINWPRVMSEISAPAGQGKIVVVEPFTDYTKVAGDEWLTFGLRDLTASMISASDQLRVYFGPSAVYNADAKNPAFVVTGMFQHMDVGLRAFVKVMAGGDKTLLSQYEILVTYPEGSELFIRWADAAKQIWKTMGVGGDNSRLDAIRDATPSIRAYESYAKGRGLLETYKISEMEVAKTWFEQTKRIDYRSPLGYQGIIDLFTFLGFYHKQRHEPFGGYFEQAQRELANMNRIAKPPVPVMLLAKKPTKKGDKTIKLENRFLLNNAAFTEGQFAADAGKWEEAAAALLKAVGYVPQDAVAWYQLARVYENLGNQAEASKALQKAYEVNQCIEK